MRVLGWLAGAALLCGTAQAQEPTMPRQPAELVSEMWAMAGICSQYPAYAVRGDALAEWLNAELNGHGEAQLIVARRDAKVAAIARDMERLRTMRSGREREERVDTNAAALMTRCNRLAQDAVAGRFFAAVRR